MTKHPQEDDAPNPVATECIDEALAPYRDLLPPEVLADFAECLDLFLTTHPVAALVVERLRPRSAPETSAEMDRNGEPLAAEMVKRNGTEEGR
jgi:hypothetical protein